MSTSTDAPRTEQQGGLFITAGGQATATAAGNTRIGRFWQALANGETVARVKINAA